MNDVHRLYFILCFSALMAKYHTEASRKELRTVAVVGGEPVYGYHLKRRDEYVRPAAPVTVIPTVAPKDEPGIPAAPKGHPFFSPFNASHAAGSSDEHQVELGRRVFHRGI